MSKRGVSLVELLVAVPVLALAAVTIFQIVSGGVRGTERLLGETNATHHAVSLLETMMSKQYVELPKDLLEVEDKELQAHLGKEFRFSSPPRDDIKRFLSVEEVCTSDSPYGGLKRIAVKVTWISRHVKPHLERKLLFETIVVNEGSGS